MAESRTISCEEKRDTPFGQHTLQPRYWTWHTGKTTRSTRAPYNSLFQWTLRVFVKPAPSADERGQNRLGIRTTSFVVVDGRTYSSVSLPPFLEVSSAGFPESPPKRQLGAWQARSREVMRRKRRKRFQMLLYSLHRFYKLPAYKNLPAFATLIQPHAASTQVDSTLSVPLVYTLPSVVPGAWLHVVGD